MRRKEYKLYPLYNKSEILSNLTFIIYLLVDTLDLDCFGWPKFRALRIEAGKDTLGKRHHFIFDYFWEARISLVTGGGNKKDKWSRNFASTTELEYYSEQEQLRLTRMPLTRSTSHDIHGTERVFLDYFFPFLFFLSSLLYFSSSLSLFLAFLSRFLSSFSFHLSSSAGFVPRRIIFPWPRYDCLNAALTSSGPTAGSVSDRTRTVATEFGASFFRTEVDLACLLA